MISNEKSNSFKLIKIKPLTVRDIKKILKQDNKDIPFDGYATKYKNTKISNYFKYNKLLKGKEQKNLFNSENFPLINVISNRKIIDQKSSLIKNLLINQNNIFLRSENNINNEPIKLIQQYNKKSNNFIFYEKNKEKAFKRVNDCLSVTSNSLHSIINNSINQNQTKKMIKIDYFSNLRKQYRTLNTREYFSHTLNNEFFQKKEEDNYVRDAYKRKIKDKLMNNVKKDLITIKYNNHIHILSESLD